MIAALLLLTMTVTVYVPRAGGINGGAITASGLPVTTGMAACGRSYPFGTQFTLTFEGAWTTVTCQDRGAWVGDRNLDIAIVSDDVKGDLRRAFAWGRRKVRVDVRIIKKERHGQDEN